MEVEFIYHAYNIIIQCNKDEKMKEIFDKFIEKTEIDINSICFVNNENEIINKELTLEKISNKNVKLTNHIKIFVNQIIESEQNPPNIKEITKTEQDHSDIKSKKVICPKCGELSSFILDDYKIHFYECKNGHKIENIFLQEFENLQTIGISKIICGQCKINNKGNTFNNGFYKCNSCKINLCPS